ncbi:DUF3574 domain-containing protein [Elioraea rosea]|uniref:DUF3574 domain-containing protein n=1 Tax=Elioraea rosea TaxID=2492390 RepID=UPI001186E2A1|nr:DUF3574 domain-containing protein [Elioraea rosea]
MIARRAALLSALALAACAAPQAAHFQSMLYLGRSMPGGGMVDDAALARFIEEEVLPRAPEGFTLLDATGHWRDTATGETVRERTAVLVLLHTPARRAMVHEIADAYTRRFGQQSVLRVETPAEARF